MTARTGDVPAAEFNASQAAIGELMALLEKQDAELAALKAELARHFDDDEAYDTPIARDFYRYQDAGGTADWPTWWERYRGDYA